MTDPIEPEAHDPNPEQTALMIKRVKRMMLIAGLTTVLGVGSLLAVIGYRMFRGSDAVATAAISATASLPRDARIVTTAVSGDRLLVTLDIGGSTEVRSYDARTFKHLGNLRFVNEP